MPKTWTFKEEEGGTTTISYSVDNASVSRTTGPDCDGTTSEKTIYFLPLSGFRTPDVQYRRGGSYTEFEVFTANPDNAAANHCVHELGWALFTDKEVISQPE